MTDQYSFASQQKISTLYKFRAFDAEHLEYIANIFLRRELHFPAPSTLNDPFECKPLIYAATPRTPTARFELQRKIRNYFKLYNVPRDERRRRSKISESPEFMAKRAKEMTEQLPKAMEEYRLCSFSTSLGSILMWSHYTNSHEEICLEFDARNDHFGPALKVEYSDDYPRLEFFDADPAVSLKAMILTKSKEWVYENEYRLITKVPPERSQLQLHDNKYIFDSKHLTGVVLGCRISAGNEKLIRNLVAAFPSPVAIKRAVCSTSNFSLEFVPA